MTTTKRRRNAHEEFTFAGKTRESIMTLRDISDVTGLKTTTLGNMRSYKKLPEPYGTTSKNGHGKLLFKAGVIADWMVEERGIGVPAHMLPGWTGKHQ